MTEFRGNQGVWVVYEMGNHTEEALVVSDNERNAIIDAHDYGTHDTKIAFWPFGMKFSDAIKKWNEEKNV